MSIPPPDPALPGLDGYVRQKRPRKESSKIVVKVGAVSVPIYRFKDRWAIIYREAKRSPRKTVSCKSEKAARAKAAEICLEIARGQVSVDRLTPDERMQAVAAKRLLAPLGLTLDGAARELAQGMELSGGAGILDLARFWARHHKAAAGARTVAEILVEMLAAKTSQGLSAEYLRNVREPMEKFAKYMAGPIGEITGREIRGYLEKVKVGAITRNHLRASIIMLFRFAQKAGDLADDRQTEAEKVSRWKEPTKIPRVYTPRQLSGWLGVVSKEWLPWMALGAFAGIRTDEIAEMDWSDILWVSKEIYVRPEIAKTGRGRYIPLQDNLVQWLLPHRKGGGKIVPASGRVNLETARMTAVRVANGGPSWDRNALRHSYGSHRFGILRDMHKLTSEMGNSVKVNEKNYQNPRSRQECVEYFNLYPAGNSKVIPMDGRAK